MKKTFKKLLSVILCAVLLFTTASTAFAAEETRTVVDSGYCGAEGENLTWTLYDDGELVISGEGEMDWYYVDYNGENPDVDVPPPWYDYYPVIDVITFEEGVTGIGNAAFSGEYNRFHRVNLPVSLQYFDGEFYWDEKTCDQGRYIAVCYAGTEEQWNQVERRTYSYSLNSEKNGYNRKPNSVVKGYKFEREKDDTNKVILCFNGSVPEPVVDIEITSFQYILKMTDNDSFRTLKAYYYPGENKAVDIVWKVNNDVIDITKSVEDTESTNIPVEISIEAVKYGESEVTAELVDKDGNLLASRSIEFTSTVPVDMNLFEAIGYYGSRVLSGIGITVGIGAVASLIYSSMLFYAPSYIIAKILSLFGVEL